MKGGLFIGKMIPVPRGIIYNSDMNEHRVLIYTYLYKNKTYDNHTFFSILDACEYSNKKPSRSPGRINNKYCDILSYFQGRDYIKSNINVNEVWQKRNYDAYYKFNVCPEFEQRDNGYGLISLEEIELLQNFSSVSISHDLLILAYLRLNMNKDPTKPLCCWRYKNTIAEDLSISENIVTNCIKELSDLDIIKYKQPRASKKDTGTYLRKPIIFCNYNHYILGENNNYIIDNSYNYSHEINKCEKFLST